LDCKKRRQPNLSQRKTGGHRQFDGATDPEYPRGASMDISSINTQIASAVANAKGVAGAASAATSGAGSTGFDFSSTLDSALKSVSQTQANAEELQKQFQLDNPNVSLEQTMIAMNESQLTFSAAVQVRNRLVQAYDSIMNMPV
jgi:flagellar hook-basal body complex protein FliE